MINKKKQHQRQRQTKQIQMRAPQQTIRSLHQIQQNAKITTWKTRMGIVFTKTVFLMKNQAVKRIVNQVSQIILKVQIVVMKITQIKKVHKVQMMGEKVVHRVEKVKVVIEEVGEIVNRKEDNRKEVKKAEIDRAKVSSLLFK